jgi:DNA-binding LytR/AlgR family response regulator
MPKAHATVSPLVLVHVSRDTRRVINIDDVYLVEASRGSTRIHRREHAALTDVRQLRQLLEAWSGRGLLRIHASYAVHPTRVFELRVRKKRRDWELRLEPPQNHVLPVSRRYLPDVWKTFGE